MNNRIIILTICAIVSYCGKLQAQEKVIPEPDSLTKAYLLKINAPLSEASRVPPIDSLLNVVRDGKGLYYKLDSLGLCLLDKKGAPIVDSLRSYTSRTLSYMRLMDSLNLPLKDTMRIPLRDSSGVLAKDSLGFLYQIDSLGLIRLDTLGSFVIDSLATFTKKELRFFARRDKRDARAIADSIYKSKFHELETYVVTDTLRYKRALSWTNDAYFNKLTFREIDTNINNSFHDYAYLKEDVGATYLGTAGSPTLTDNYFKRKKKARFEFWDAGMYEAYDRENIPFYNTKSPYTVMSYAGTLRFANKQTEESNVSFLHTQNLSPAANFQFYYQRKGSKGLLENEATNTRTLSILANYLGKRYVMHGGLIINSLRKDENGGISDESFIRDTVVEARAIPVNLGNASSALRNTSVFITQSYGIPINIFKRDSLETGDGTMMILGHSGEWENMSRNYTDVISTSDSYGRSFYHGNFYLNPTSTSDSVRTIRLDNRFFIRLQPWSRTAIVSKLEGGAGYELLNNYFFRPEFYVLGTSGFVENNLYVYAGASGQLSRYFEWNATGRFDFAGYYIGDMLLDANARFSIYPLPSGVHLTGRFYLKNYTPDWYTQHYYSNHFVWDNEFGKVTDTRIEAALSIPDWKLSASFSYGLLNKGIYYDTLGIVRQADKVVNIMTATLTKNFRIWYFHLDNRILFQLTSDKEMFPLPVVSANLRYYLEFPVVKDVMTMQIGADVTFQSAYYMQAYNPALGVFHLQNKQVYGSNPYIDAFVNLKWKRATIFVKYINAAQGWPASDYFAAPNYIRPQRAFKLGMTWPFYIRPQKKSGSTGSGIQGQPQGSPGNLDR